MSAPKTAASRLARLAARVAAVGAIALACATGLPAPALADSVTCGELVLAADDAERTLESGADYVYENNVLTIKTTDPVTVSMSAAGATTAADRIVVEPGADKTAHVTIDGVQIDVSTTENAAAMELSSGSLELTLEGDSTLKSGADCAGLQNNENPLTISGTGSLEAMGGSYGAGVGGGQGVTGSNITIEGGTVTAKGGDSSAGIGGGQYAGASNIVISGGEVKATGGKWGAGIGGGDRGRPERVVISGGCVSATGGESADAIGGGGSANGPDGLIIGGCFPEAAVKTDEATGISSVYGIEIEYPCSVSSNSDPSTSVNYPYEVVRAADLLVSGVNGSEPAYGEGGDYYYSDSGTVLHVVGETPMRVYMGGGPVHPADDSAATTDRIVVDPGEKDDGADNVAHVTIDGVNIDVSETTNAAAMIVSSGALELELAGDSSLKSGDHCAGLQNGENPLTVSGAGALEATGSLYGAGIGGGANTSGSNIAISGGIVTAKGGDSSAGIGGGQYAGASNVVISGGEVVATGGELGAGIGGGHRGTGSDIAIEGGTVVATGGTSGAGIGGGQFGSGSDIDVEGGAVTAKGGDYAAGIGGGALNNGSNIIITGGFIDAAAGDGAQPIGSGSSASGESIVSITGGSFADAADNATTADTVYGVAVAAGYDVVANADPETQGEYPVSVVRTESDLVVSPASGGDEPAYGAGGDYYCSPDGVLHIISETPMTVSMAEGIETTTNRIAVEPGTDKAAHVTLDGVSIDVSATDDAAAMLVSSGALELELAGESGNFLKSGYGRAGLQNGDNPLTISGTGTLEAVGGASGAGIGGGNRGSGSNITVEGGTVTAMGGVFGAGVGGGANGQGSDIRIEGGAVAAMGGGSGAGIGGGNRGSGSNITIEGGCINVTVVGDAQPIGGGANATGESTVSIIGGCFAAGAVDETSPNAVYGIEIKLPCELAENDDPDTKTEYPYMVTRSSDLLVSGVEGEDEPAYGEDGDYYYESGTNGAVLHILGETPIRVYMGGNPMHPAANDNAATTDRIVVEPGAEKTAHVTLKSVNIDVSATAGAAAMQLSSGALELTLEGESSLKSGASCAGLQNGENPLIIAGDGSLVAEGGEQGAGIGGGGYHTAGSNITITGGSITAQGGKRAAGIGGGGYAAGSNITISGGRVKATGNGGGAGIGSGPNKNATGVVISGGFIEAVGSGDAAEIGGGDGRPASDEISITGGCFAAGAADDVSSNTVYGIVPAPAYAVADNDDPDTSAEYPYEVVRTADLLVSGVEGGAEPAYGEDGGDYYYEQLEGASVLHIVGETPMRVYMGGDPVHPAADDSAATTDRIVVDPGEKDGEDRVAHVTIDGVNIDVSETTNAAAMLISSGTLELELVGENSLRSGYDSAGLQNGTGPLTISGDGSLSARGGYGAAGIGGGYEGDGSNITIEGGTVTATGGDSGAGIGGGAGSAGSNISITGGFVDAVPGGGAQAIGGGSRDSSSNISITGGSFADTAGDAASSDKVYGVAVAAGYDVVANTDGDTAEDYPASVVRTASDLVVSPSGGGTEPAYGAGGDYYCSPDGVLHIVSEAPMTVSMVDGVETATTGRIVVDPGAGKTAHVTIDGVKIDVSATENAAAMQLSSGALELTLAGNSTLKSGANCAGLQNGENPLTISGAGSLEAMGGSYGAGIGGGNRGFGSNITIVGGAVTAMGGDRGAGIGGGWEGSGSNIAISGGTVTATGGLPGGGAGIGGGDGQNGSNITIEGGCIDVTAGAGAQPIGRGAHTTVESTVSITGGRFAAGAASWDVRDAVYGVGLASGYVAANNEDEGTKGYYLYEVVGVDLLVGAAGDGAAPAYGTDYYYSDSGTVLHVVGTTPMTVSMADELARPAEDGTSTTDRIVVEPGEKDDGADRVAHVTIDDVRIDVSATENAAAMLVSSGALELTLEEESSLESGDYCAGLQNGENPLAVSGEGSLEATGGEWGAGIGGGFRVSGSSIAVRGGTVKATGGEWGAGIGGGYYSPGSDIVISGGAVTAQGGFYGAGIGGGARGSGSNITIEGGTVAATGGGYAAGIGGGDGQNGSDIRIEGGFINAAAENGAQPIGNGADATVESTVSITGGSFADADADAVSSDKVYGVAVATGYDVVENTDGDTAEDYPVSVVRAASDLVVSPSGEGDELVYGAGGDYYCSPDGVLHIISETPMTVTMAAGVGTTTDRIAVEPGTGKTAHVTLKSVRIDVSATDYAAAMLVSSGELDLTLVNDSSLKSGYGCAGLQNGSPITISGEGSLEALGGRHGAGIGGGVGGSGLDITIEGGTVTAWGGIDGAGIGGGREGSGSNITISSGTVAARGMGLGAGIGAGASGLGSDIRIEGGCIEVAAESGTQPIGNGADVQGESNVSITGGRFAEGAVSGDVRDVVYGVGLASGYVAVDNEDPGTQGFYPYEIIRADLLVGASGEKTPAYGESGDYYYSDGGKVLNIVGETPMTVSMADELARPAEDGASTTDRIVVEPGEKDDGADNVARVTLDDVNIDASATENAAAMLVSSGALELGLAGDSSLRSGYGCAGLQNGDNSLVISGTGTLSAQGGDEGAGIGGGDEQNGSNIAVEGGTVTAQGGLSGAGIGGGDNSSGSNITIVGGTITATGGSKGAGIGGGDWSSGSNITIAGGTVTATGGDYGAGVGGGLFGDCSDIRIEGGCIDAAAGRGAQPIGSGLAGSPSSNISITGGCFAEGAVSDSEPGRIYGIELAPGYFVTENGDMTTAGSYPHAVGRSDLLVGAADDGGAPAYGTDYRYSPDGVLHIVGTTPMTVSMADELVHPAGDETATTDRIVVEPGTGKTARVTIDGVRVDVSGSSGVAAMLVSSGSLELELASDSSLRSGRDCAGLQNGENTLTVSGTGSLSATGGEFAAGIGGGNQGSGSNIAISGGTVTATGLYHGAGIGGGCDGSGSNITIDGGTVVATGAIAGAGIGGGTGASGSNVTVSGGTVTARGGESGGAAIGGGGAGYTVASGSNISVTGGFIDATPGADAQPIGSGSEGGSSSNISITGGRFADEGAVLANASDATVRGTVYGVSVPADSEGGDGYAVVDNPDGKTVEKYPVAVVPAMVQADSSLALAEGAEFTYDGDPVEADALTVTGGAEGTDPTFEHRAEGAGDEAWAEGLPVGAGSWQVRATVSLPHGSGYSAEDETFYFGDGVTDAVDVVVGKAPLTVAAEDKTVAFNGELPELTYTVTGFKGEDDASVVAGEPALTCDYEQGVTAAGEELAIEVDVSKMSADNYTFTAQPGTLTVTQSASAIELDATELSATYGDVVTVKGAVSATGEKAEGLLAMLASLAAPSEDQVALFYNEAQVSDPETVGEGGSFSLAYDTTDKAVPAGSEQTLEVRYVGTGDQADASAQLTLTIAKAELTVTAEDKTVAFSGELPELTYTVTGFKGEDDASVVAGEPALTCGYEQGVTAAGEELAIEVDVSGMSADNYTFTAQPGTLTVAKSASAIALDATELSATYGDSVTVTGSVAATGAPATRALAAPAPDQVALFYNEAQVSDPATVGEGGSFSLAYGTASKAVPAGSEQTLEVRYVGTGDQAGAAAQLTLTIAPRTLTASVAGSATRTYDATTTAPADGLSIELAGAVDGDDVSATAASYAFDSAGAGEGKDVTASGVALAGADAGWYGLSADTATGTGLGTVERAPLTVRALPQEVVFGAELPEVATPAYGTHFELEGFVGGETAETPGAWSGAPAVGFDDQYRPGSTPAGTVLEGAVTVSAGTLSAANYEFAEFVPAGLTVLRSATDPGVDEGVETDYTYGDVIVVAGAVAATGDAAEDGVAAMSLEAPAPGQVALYWRDADGDEVQLSDPVTPAADGSYELAYDTAERLVPAGEQTLLVRFAGTGDMADAVQELTVAIGRATLTPRIEGTATKPYDGTTAYLGEDARVTLSGVAGSDDPLGTYALDFEHEGAGAQRLIASEVTLAEGEDAWYELAATTAEGENAGGGIVKAAQQAPSGATGEGEKVAGGDDGSITGVVPGPGGASWRPAGSGDDAWQPVPEGGTVEGLAPGDYEVRQEGDANHEASDAATVTVPSFSDEHGGISYPDGTTEGEGGLPVLPEGGGTVTWPDGTEAALPGGTAVDPDTGVATTPGGTSVTPGGDGTLDVTFPGGAEATVPGGSEVGDGAAAAPDGTVVAPGEGGTLDVTFPDGTQATVPGGSEVAGGSVTAPGGTVVAPDGGGGLTVTLPDGTAVSAPSGSSVAAGTVVGPDGVRVWPVEDEKPEDEGPEGEKPEGEKPAEADKDDGLARTSDPTALLAPAALAAAGVAVLLARRRVA